MSDSIFDVIDRRFMSGNSVCVERVHIKSDEWADLKYELFAAREENERVRQASLDGMMHFEDMKDAKEQAEARAIEAVRAQQGQGRAIGEIDEGEEGVFVELYPDNTFTIGQKVYTHPPKANDCKGGQDCSHCEPGYV